MHRHKKSHYFFRPCNSYFNKFKMSKIRSEVLKAFKKLHRTRQFVFQEDERALVEGRKQINENFRKNKDEANETEIRKMLQLALDVEKELRTNVIQATQKDHGVFELRITEDTTRLDNYVFNPDAIIERPKRKANCPVPDDGSQNHIKGCAKK